MRRRSEGGIKNCIVYLLGAWSGVVLRGGGEE
jgi:hypothetical protein